jgi:hypothetical protein
MSFFYRIIRKIEWATDVIILQTFVDILCNVSPRSLLKKNFRSCHQSQTVRIVNQQINNISEQPTFQSL